VKKWSQRSSPKYKSKEESQFAKTFWWGKMTKGRVITGDETWDYQYDPETKRRSAQWKTANSPRPKTFRQSKSRVKIMLLTFFYIRGIVHYEFVPTGQSTKFTIWKYWKGCVKKMETTRTFGQQLMDLASWQCTYSHVTVCEGVLATKHITVLEHPAYSPNLAPQWLFSVPEDKRNIERKAFWWHWWHQE